MFMFFFAAFFNPKNLEREIEKTWRIFLVLVEDLKETAKKIEHLLLILHEETAGHRLLQELGFAWFQREITNGWHGWHQWPGPTANTFQENMT